VLLVVVESLCNLVEIVAATSAVLRTGRMMTLHPSWATPTFCIRRNLEANHIRWQLRSSVLYIENAELTET
jgi:hypothetical protein